MAQHALIVLTNNHREPQPRCPLSMDIRCNCGAQGAFGFDQVLADRLELLRADLDEQ